jgi:hypothetical protein
MVKEVTVRDGWLCHRKLRLQMETGRGCVCHLRLISLSVYSTLA